MLNFRGVHFLSYGISIAFFLLLLFKTLEDTFLNLYSLAEVHQHRTATNIFPCGSSIFAVGNYLPLLMAEILHLLIGSLYMI